METDANSSDVAIVLEDPDLESGSRENRTMRRRNGLLSSAFRGVQNVGSYFFPRTTDADNETDEADEDAMLEKHATYLLDGLAFSFKPEHMNNAFLDYVSDKLLHEIPIPDWDRVALDDELLPSFNSGYDDEGEADYWVHPLAPRLAIELELDVNAFSGVEASVPFSCNLGDGWILGHTDVWIAELRLVSIESDIPTVPIEIRAKLGDRDDFLPCLCNEEEISGKGNLLKPDETKDKIVLARNTMCGLYVSGMTAEELCKYGKRCGESSECVLVERTLTSTVLLETVRVSLPEHESKRAELKHALKVHDGKFYKLKKETWEMVIEEVEPHLSAAPLHDVDLALRRYDGQRWDELTKAESRQKIHLKFEIHPVMHFRDEGEKMIIIKKLIE